MLLVVLSDSFATHYNEIEDKKTLLVKMKIRDLNRLKRMFLCLYHA